MIGVCGEIHPLAAENYGIDKTRVYMLVIKLEELLECSDSDVKYTALPRFPASVRDLSLVCDSDVSNGEIGGIISKNAKHLESVRLFDIYTGEQIPEGKKSLSYKLTFRKADGTLTDEECDKAVGKIINALSEKNIILRT